MTSILTAPVILAVDTATLGGSVCLVRGKTLLASRVGNPEVSHSNSLLNDINQCLESGQVLLRDVDLFAAAAGPGSFTGLRIGLATVKALAATLGRPCVGIPTLHAIAHATGPSSATVALLPAGRGEVFVQLLSVSSDGNVDELDAPAHLSPQKMLDKYSALRNLKWSGKGAHLHRDFLGTYAREKGIEFRSGSPAGQPCWGARESGLPEIMQYQGWTLAPDAENLSQHVAALASQHFERGEVVEPHALNAIYVRPSDAELKCP